MSSDLERRIRQRAYELWEAEGQPEGRDSHHWTQAEAEFAEARTVESAASDAAAPKRGKRAKPSESLSPSSPDTSPPAPAAPRSARSGARKTAKS